MDPPVKDVAVANPYLVSQSAADLPGSAAAPPPPPPPSALYAQAGAQFAAYGQPPPPLPSAPYPQAGAAAVPHSGALMLPPPYAPYALSGAPMPPPQQQPYGYPLSAPPGAPYGVNPYGAPPGATFVVVGGRPANSVLNADRVQHSCRLAGAAAIFNVLGIVLAVVALAVPWVTVAYSQSNPNLAGTVCSTNACSISFGLTAVTLCAAGPCKSSSVSVGAVPKK